MAGGAVVAGGRLVAALVACCVLVAGCSSGDNSTAITTSTAATLEVDWSDTTPTTSTSSAFSSASSPLPSSSTSATTSTLVESTPSTSTTVDPASSAESAARQAVERAIADFTTCLLALPSCDPAMLAATRADPMLTVNTNRINEWNTAGYAVVDRDQFRYVIEEVELSDDRRRAVVTLCFADGSKLVDPGAGPDGADLIIDGTFTSGREVWDVRLDDDGVWRAYDAPLVGAAEATDVCPAV